MADAAASAPPVPSFAETGGVLLFCGGTDYDNMGRTKNTDYPNIPTPSRVSTVMDKKFISISTGPAACHFAAVSTEGKVYTWGRNEDGQLGLGNFDTTFAPTEVKGELEGKHAVSASCGKGHTLVLTADGEVYGFGTNKYGQLGLGYIRAKGKDDDIFSTPVRARAAPPKVVRVGCGAEFSMMMTESGELCGCGKGEYGVLGDGSDHSYNKADSSIKIVFEPVAVPAAIKFFEGKKVVNFACGLQHTIAITEDGKCYTWGFGGYGRLGHRVQQDELTPREVLDISWGNRQARMHTTKDSLLAAGATSTLTTTSPVGQLYAWGKLKVNGDNLMYPTYMDHLQGWKLRDMACGHSTFVVAAENSVISWGHALYQELGYGEGGKKSSANPCKVDIFENVSVHKVGAAFANTLYIIDAASDLAKFPIYEPPAADPTRALKRKQQQEEKAASGRGRGAKKQKQ